MSSRTALVLGIVLMAALLITLGKTANAAGMPSTTEVENQAFLVINEYMASNNGGLEDPDEPGEYPDWFELYNTGKVTVSLDGLSIVKGGLSGSPVTFNVTDGLSVGPGSFILFYADNDAEQGPLHTNFKLRKEGDELALYGSNGTKEIDLRTFGAQATDISEGRVPDGSNIWRRLLDPSPGGPNYTTTPRIVELTHRPALPTKSDDVRVTAVISDDGTIVAANLVYAVDDSGTISVPMTSGNGRLFTASIPRQRNGAVVRYYATAIDDEGLQASNPGSPDRSGSGYQVGYVKPTIVINEVMAANDSVFEDPQEKGEYPDWFELHNYGRKRVSLAGLYLTDNPQRGLAGRTKFAITDSLTIAPGGYMIFIADDDGKQGARHLSFQLDENGESVAVYGAFGLVEIDLMTYGEQISDSSMGRYPNGAPNTWQVLYCVTPGAANILCDEQVYLPLLTR